MLKQPSKGQILVKREEMKKISSKVFQKQGQVSVEALEEGTAPSFLWNFGFEEQV